MTSNEKLAIGIDFGGTSIKIGVVQGSEIIASAEPIKTAAFPDPIALIDEMAARVKALQQQFPEVIGVGIGVPGVVDFHRGITVNLANVVGWQNIALRDLMKERVNLPVAIDNDAKAMTLAEWRYGAGKGEVNLVCMTLGTGVGGGVVLNGEIIRGASNSAGEIGQTSIDYNSDMIGAYGNRGSLDDYLGNREITARAQKAYQAANQTRSIEECTPALLAKSALEGDAIALAIWDEISTMLATGVMNIFWLICPDKIIIGGGMSNAGDLLFKPLNEKVKAQLSPLLADYVQIIPAAFGSKAGLIGAAALVRKN